MSNVRFLSPPSKPKTAPRLADFRFSTRVARISPEVVAGFIRIGEFVLLGALGLLIALAYVPHRELADTPVYLASSLGAAISAVLLMEAIGLYRSRAISNAALQIPQAVTAWTVVVALFVAGLFVFKASEAFSRFWLMSWFLAGVLGLISTRSILAIAVRSWAKAGRLNKRAVIYGGGSQCKALLKAFESDPDTDIRICGVFDDRNDRRTERSQAGYPKLGALSDLIGFIRKTGVDLVIVSMPLAAEKRLMQVVATLSELPVDIRLASTSSQIRFNPRAYSYIGSVAMLDLADKPISDWGIVVKSLFDRAVALGALIALAPLMMIVAAAIKLDSKGPILFRQKRYGFNNELIEVFKFRSMFVDMCDAQAINLVTKDDPRVTPVGRFIRKTSIDELPQLFNVLFGDLSLVGPRPHALQAKAADKFYDAAVTNYFARHKVKPGITGWAQINGWRGETDTEEKIRKRVECDLYYIDNWSLFFDLYILLKTPLALFKSENAY